ncbi:TPA: hypothetical protein HA338_03980, partial [Methanosarcina acetivorans]|nr:hypothetical protein [Methanosarcina acetivorans]
ERRKKKEEKRKKKKEDREGRLYKEDREDGFYLLKGPGTLDLRILDIYRC